MKIDIAAIARNNGKKGTIEIKQQPVPKIEAVQYFKTLNKLTKSMRDDIRVNLLPVLKALKKKYTTDSYVEDITQVVAMLSLKYANKTESVAKLIATKMVNGVATRNKKGFEKSFKNLTGVDLSEILVDEGLTDFLDAQVSKNVSLIKSIPQEYFKSIETVVMNGVANGLRFEEIAKQIGGIKGISSVNGKLQNRIKLIARNETSNINASINKMRQESLGVKEFKWVTAHDERVRPSHAKINGNIYSWDNLPTVDGVKTSPGQSINCRCIAIPVIKI